MVQRKCKSNTIKLAWIAEVQPSLKILNGCRIFLACDLAELTFQ